MLGRSLTKRRGSRRAATAALAAAAGLAALAPAGPAAAQVWRADFNSVAYAVNVWGFNGGHADHTGLKSFTYRGVTYNVTRISVSGTDEMPLQHLRFELDKPVPEELVLGLSASPSTGSASISVNTTDGRKSNGGKRLDFTLPHGIEIFEDGSLQRTTAVKAVLSDFSPFHLRLPVIREVTSPSDTSMEISWELHHYSKFHPERHVDGWEVELRREGGSTRKARIADTATTAHVFSGLTTGERYYVRVRPRFNRAEFNRDAWNRWSLYAMKVAGATNPVDPVTTEFMDIPGAPELSARPGYVKASGTEVVLNFTENIRHATRTTVSNGVEIVRQDYTRPTPDLFSVLAPGAGGAVTFESILVTGTRQIVLMGGSPKIPRDATVTVSYTDPGPGTDNAPEEALNDWAGNDVASFYRVEVDNRSTQAPKTTPAPTPLTARYQSGDDTRIQIEFDISIEPDNFPAASTFGVTIGGEPVRVAGASRSSGSDKRVVVRIHADDANAAPPATVGYTRPTASGANRLKDRGGRQVKSFTMPVRPESAELTLSVADVTVREAAGAVANFAVTLTPVWHEDVKVQIATRNGTARAGQDFHSHSSSFTFTAGVTSKTFAVRIIDDDVEDSGETFEVRLSNARGPRFATFVLEHGTGTITNHEIEKPRVTGVAVLADESGDGVWTAGEAIAVRLDFSEAVTVSGGRPTVDFTFAGLPAPVPLFYASGSGTGSLVFSEEVLDGEIAGVALAADSLNARGARIASHANGTAAALGHPGTGGTGETEETEEPETPARPALTAEFTGAPASHGGDAFTVALAFSEEFTLSYRLLQGADGQASVIAAAGGAVTGARRAERGENRRWIVTIEPDGDGDVTLVLPPTTDCGAADAICTGDSRPLSAAATARVPGAEPSGAPFTARLASLPAAHDGADTVVFEVHFSENPPAYSYRTLRDATLAIAQGGIRLAPAVSRLEIGSNLGWRVTVDPVSKADIAIAIAATADCAAAGAVCNGDGEPLSEGAAAAIPGPPGLAVADARVREAAGATMDFAVTLSRAAASTVTVGYATADASAVAGADYTATSGTLSFAPGETARTVSVPVLDDAIDDDGEAFTLALSNPTGGAWLADASAVGTIENTDAMPTAWLARFGRTVASHAVDAIGARLRGGGRDTRVTVAGQLLALSRGAATEKDRARAEAALAALAESGATLTRSMTGREALLRSAFSIAAGGRAGRPAFGAWGRVAASGFRAEDGGTRFGGDVATGFLGADIGNRRWLAGVALSLSEGEGSYAQMAGPDGGGMESSLTAFYPYARLGLGDRLDLWGVAGYGEGTLSLRQHAGADRPRALRHRTGIAMRMAAVGARGEVLTRAETGGLAMAVRSDALWVRTTSDAARGGDGALAASKSEVTRLRLAVEGSHTFPLTMGALTPALELGLRHDGGDAETGFGVEAGGSLRYEGKGFSVEGAVHALIAHRDEGHREWGASGALRIDPGAAGQGLSVTLAPSLGAARRGGGLWSAAGAAGLAAFRPERRLDSEIGYGVALPGAGVLTPHAGLALGGVDGRAWRIGARWRPAPGATLALQATRREPPGAATEHGVELRGALGW